MSTALATTQRPIRCGCGHASRPTPFAPGYAVDETTGKTLCYSCAARHVLERAKTMRPGDPPLFLYLRGELPAPMARATNQVTTWDGTILGSAIVNRGAKSDAQMRVEATIDGRKFWGRTPTNNGTYVRLRPYRNQENR